VELLCLLGAVLCMANSILPNDGSMSANGANDASQFAATEARHTANSWGNCTIPSELVSDCLDMQKRQRLHR